MIFLEFSKRFFTFYFWELECFFVLKRCFSLRPFQWYIVRLATRTGSVSNPNRRIWPYYRLLPPGRRDPHVRTCTSSSDYTNDIGIFNSALRRSLEELVDLALYHSINVETSLNDA